MKNKNLSLRKIFLNSRKFLDRNFPVRLVELCSSPLGALSKILEDDPVKMSKEHMGGEKFGHIAVLLLETMGTLSPRNHFK